jgi:hypothetical protein
MFGNILSKVLQVGTLGMVNVNPTTGTITIKDPITGIGNTLAEAKDAVLNDFDSGVWIGKRPPDGYRFGASTYVTEHFNMNGHYAVRVSGQSW